jgi:tetratricopeptide (TPR) repeat protein/predicted Ser/Thr protein kinase
MVMRSARPASFAADPAAASAEETRDDEPLTADHTHATIEWPHLEPGAVVGRYTVLRELGAGGMGVVYAAYDPELDRQVALKLVLPGKADGEGRIRLLREAQALAKLSHRNVVAIHDVGTMGEQVWLAMELVHGQTLGKWLKQRRHWREVLGVMRKAGRGLAAAHEAGLLHRDLKPGNVMVGERGRVWVMDFGLAREGPSMESPPTEESTLEAEPGVDTLGPRVTKAGMLMGTPLYMAPEQLMGRELTPAIDQFALCVTLWEGLYGERPFEGRTLDELVDNVLAGRVREPRMGRGAPGWLRRVCEKGLSVEPGRRFASVEELLEALAKGRTRSRMRKGLAAVGVLGVLWAGAEGYRQYDTVQRTAACEASGDEVEVAWNAERRQKLHDALVATGVSYAPTTAEKVMPWLEQQAQAWRDARVEGCLDAEVRGRWSAETLDRSLWCLDERRTELESLVDELMLADGSVQKAVQAAAGLPLVAPCRDERVLETLTPPLDDRRAVQVVRAEVTRVANLRRTGRYEKGLELARGTLARAEALAWRPLSATARFWLGALLERTGAYADAESTLEDAYFEATDGVAPQVAVDAATRLVYVVGVSSARHAEGRRWSRHAEVALASVRDGEHLRRAHLLSNVATLHNVAGAYAEARANHEQVVAIREQVLGLEHPDMAVSLNNLASVHYAMGGYDEAKTLQERALAIQEEVLGPEHPDVAMSLGNLAVLHDTMGSYDDAKTLQERALAIEEKALGPEHPDVALSLVNLATIYRAIGAYEEATALCERALVIQEKALGLEHPEVAVTLNDLATFHQAMGAYAEARVLIERALVIQEKKLGPEHPQVAASLDNLATGYYYDGAYDKAQSLYERALTIEEKALGTEHPDVAKSLNNLANIQESKGDYDRARSLYERALAVFERALGRDHPKLAHPLVGLAEVALRQGRPSDAVQLAQRAVVVWEKHEAKVEELAHARFALARALWEAPVDGGRDRTQAMILAEHARGAFRHARRGSVTDLSEVEQWIEDHREDPERADP